MKKILLFGAGKSASALISFLAEYAETHHCRFQVCDQNLAATTKKLEGFTASEAISIDVTDETARQSLIGNADIVISLLPPALHILIARDCVLFSKNLLTASYVDEAMAALADEVRKRDILFLAEMGLDPGIDHMSAMHIIDKLKEDGATLDSFYSHCGGLIAPESDDNPWHYKVTWNPANVVMAGSNGARYLERNKQIQIPYESIFSNRTQQLDVEELGLLSWYANRDSIPYIETYGLQGIKNFIRTTLRYPEFMQAWNVLVQLKLTSTDDGGEIASCETLLDWYTLKSTAFRKNINDEIILRQLEDETVRNQLAYLGLFSKESLPNKISSAKILQSLIEKNLIIHPADKDMIVMVHEVGYRKLGQKEKLVSTLIVKGEDSVRTAMSKTVGMPLAIAATLILEEKITLKGLHIPVLPEIYEPVLQKLKDHGIIFHEKKLAG